MPAMARFVVHYAAMVRQQPYLQARRPGIPEPRRNAPRDRTLAGIAVATLVVAVIVLFGALPHESETRVAAADVTPTPPVDVAATGTTTLSGEAGLATSPAPVPIDLPGLVIDGPGDVALAPTATPAPVAAGDPTSGSPFADPPTSAAPEQLTGYRWPLYQARMTSFFAPRDTGFLVVDGQRIHQGLDITTFCGDEVLAAHGGTVVAAGRRFAYQIGFIEPPEAFYRKIDRTGTIGSLPIVVVIDDGNGYRSMYVHLSQASVKQGDVVRTGDLVGLEGMTGNATGCHLHYELVRMDGPWMRVAAARVKVDLYPAWQRERIDPLRVLSLKDKRAARFVPGIEPPRVSPGLGRPTVRQR